MNQFQLVDAANEDCLEIKTTTTSNIAHISVEEPWQEPSGCWGAKATFRLTKAQAAYMVSFLQEWLESK